VGGGGTGLGLCGEKKKIWSVRCTNGVKSIHGGNDL
jgi:hypothetical protein